MKTTLTAATLTLLSSVVSTSSAQGYFASPDLDSRYYPRPANLAEPVKSGVPVEISLFVLQTGNPDGYHGFIEGYQPRVHSGIASTSLEELTRGNPDFPQTWGSAEPALKEGLAVVDHP